MDRILNIVNLFLSFLKISAFSFGGGYAMLPFLEREIIHSKKWLSYKEFLDVLALSQASPGPIAINAATFIGYKQEFILGSIFATLGVISFSILCMNMISPAMEKYKENKYLSKILRILRPITIGFILASAYSTFNKSILDMYSFLLFIFSFALLFSKKIHPIFIIIGSGIVGIILKGA